MYVLYFPLLCLLSESEIVGEGCTCRVAFADYSFCDKSTLYSIYPYPVIFLSIVWGRRQSWLPQTALRFLPIHYTTLRHSTALYTAALYSTTALYNCTERHSTALYLPSTIQPSTESTVSTHYYGRYNTATTYIRAFLPYRTVPLPYRDSRFFLNPNTWTLADIHPFPHQTRSSIAGTQVSANQTRYSPHCLHIPQKQLRLIGSYLDSEQNISRHTQKESFY